MINLDFSTAIAIYIIISLGLLLALWLFSRQQKTKDSSLDPRFIWSCSVCTYTYFSKNEDNISVCPRCGSYNKKKV